MNTSEILNRAADLIEQRGWTQASGDPEQDPWGKSGDNALCLEGGIMAAAGVRLSYEVVSCPAYRAVWNHLQDDSRWGPFRDRLYDWNDRAGRTPDEVVEVLRAAAVIEEAREEPGAACQTYAEQLDR